MTETGFCVTREKHMDHMVKVVPFIVCAYALQCYFFMKLGPVNFALDGLYFLGGCLASMIMGFITYDLTHVVKFGEDSFSISVNWLNYEKCYAYKDLIAIEVSEVGQPFGTLTLTTQNGKKFGIYFVDAPDKIKAWLEQKRMPELQKAA